MTSDGVLRHALRKKMVQHITTVEGFAKAACKYLTPDERTQLIQKLL
jgi:hypothetical protein